MRCVIGSSLDNRPARRARPKTSLSLENYFGLAGAAASKGAIGRSSNSRGLAKRHCARVVGGGPLGLCGFLGGRYDALKVQVQRYGGSMLHTQPLERSQFFFMALQSAPSHMPLHEHWRVKTLHLKSRLPGLPGGAEPVLGAVCAAVSKATNASKTIPSARIFV
jgi:hypothetical protein